MIVLARFLVIPFKIFMQQSLLIEVKCCSFQTCSVQKQSPSWFYWNSFPDKRTAQFNICCSTELINPDFSKIREKTSFLFKYMYREKKNFECGGNINKNKEKQWHFMEVCIYVIQEWNHSYHSVIPVDLITQKACFRST